MGQDEAKGEGIDDLTPWAQKDIRLKFSFGEFQLFAASIPARVLERHFTDLPTDPSLTPLPIQCFDSGAQALLIRSHPSTARLPRLALVPNAIRYVPSQYLHYFVDLAGSFPGYLQTFSSKTRSTLLRKVRKFTDYSGGSIHWRQFYQAGEMEDFYALARTVSARTYQEKMLDAGLPSSAAFREHMHVLASAGQVRGYILFASEQPIAYLYCPVSDGVVLYEYLGYDPDFQSYSPGTVLQYLALQSLFEEHTYRIFDFTEGEGDHKRVFSTGSLSCADIYYFRRSLRSVLLLALHAGLSSTSAVVAKASHALRIKSRIKRFVRRKASASSGAKSDDS